MTKVLNYKIVNLNSPEPPKSDRPSEFSNVKFVPFGSDNLLPQNFAAIARQSAIHRSIINNKIIYTLGKEMQTPNELLLNANGETLTDITRKVLFDWLSGGNGYIDIVTDARRSFFAFYHLDYTTVRADRSGDKFLLHPEWAKYNSQRDKTQVVPMFPNFDKIRKEDGKQVEGEKLLHSVYQWRNYEPEFNYYGIPSWFGALNEAVIDYKTAKWNLSRINNSFANSGVLNIDGDFSQDEANKITKKFLETMTGEGNQGKVLVMVRERGGSSSEFTPITTDNDGDWQQLQDQVITKLITAHNWFRSLSGIPDNTGFDTTRIMNEYQIAMNTTVSNIRQQITNMWYDVAGIDNIEFINTRPLSAGTGIPAENYTYIWEARRDAGLDYDENDINQQKFVKDGSTGNSRTSGE